MKKIKMLLILLISIFTFNLSVFAANGNLQVSSGSVFVGDSFTVSANISSAAAWNVHVSARGPVSGCVINQADATADAMDTNKTFSATCTATGEGVITVVLSGDVTSASDGIAVGISGSRAVNVSKRPAQPNNSNNPNNNNNNNTINNNNNVSNNANNNVNDKSNNNNIKELSVDGYSLVKVDANNYTLSVPNDISSINVKAIAEDSKATVTGAGNHQLSVGENNVEIVVTSESGLQNKINIKVTRKDGFYLEDLDSLLNNDKIDDINIIINNDTTISSQHLEKIKKSKKTVKFNYYNDDKHLVYSWIIDGTKLKNTNDLLTTITFESENKKNILRLANYCDGIFINVKQLNNFKEGIKIKLFVGNKYDKNDKVNVYSYVKSNDKLNLVKSKVKVDDGYIEFDSGDASDYLITMSTVPDALETISPSNSSISIALIVIIVFIILLVISILAVYILKKKKLIKGKMMK